jgi:AcrR family transcriptional regulator
MLPTHRERKKEKNRNDIIECAVSLFKEKGFAETTIEEILEKAVISKGTLYNYFPDKESILAGYFQNKVLSESETFRTRLAQGGDIRARLGSLLDFMHQMLAGDLDLAGVYFRYRMKNFGGSFDSSRRSGMETLIVELVKWAQEKGEVRADVPPLVLAKNFHFLFMSFLIFNTQENLVAEKPLQKEQVIDLFLNGASAP